MSLRRTPLPALDSSSSGVPDLHSPVYRQTQAAWERIWAEESSIDQELQTLDYPRSKRIRSLFLPHLRPGDRVLEAGCGLGVELVALQSAVPRVIGVDYSLGALRQIRRREANHRIGAADVHRLPFEAEAFDAVLSFGVVEHFEFGPAPALREVWRVLRPGGTLVLTVPYPNLVWRLARLRRRAGIPRSGSAAGYFETNFTASQIRRYVTEAGFVVIAGHPIGHSFTLWGLGGALRGPGYYQTSRLAERLGAILLRAAPWAMCSASLWIARKSDADGPKPPR